MPSLYPYQEDTVRALLGNKHICIAMTGTGKTAIGLTWAKHTGKRRVVVITTAGVRDAKNYEKEADIWGGAGWRASLASFEVISWAKFSDWLAHCPHSLDEYAVIYDEVDSAKAGVSSKRGKAFITLSTATDTWTGYTATAGEKWLDFYPYFCAAGLVKNKTQFLNTFANTSTFRGFPEITSYKHEDTLKKMWEHISYITDASTVLSQLPAETHQAITFKPPRGYKQCRVKSQTLEGEFLDTTMALCHYLRQICLTKQKLQWVEDFVAHTPERIVIFYNYIEEGDKLATVLAKLKRKVWRIDGAHHEIPTEDTIGERDVVLVQWASGSRGLNLQFINYWVSVSPNYSYSISVQGRGRIKRIGQKRPMWFYYLMTEDTIEEDIYKCLKAKKDFSEETYMLKT